MRQLIFVLRIFHLRVECEELAGGFTDLRQCELHAPDLSLAAEAILAEELELLVETLLLVRPTRGLRGLRVVTLGGDGRHASQGVEDLDALT